MGSKFGQGGKGKKDANPETDGDGGADNPPGGKTTKGGEGEADPSAMGRGTPGG